MPPANSARRSMNVLPWDVVRRLCGILLVLLATLGLSGTLSLSAAVDKFEGTWREFRIPPFEVIAENDTRELRAFLGDLFQYRYLLRRVLPIEEPKAQWPIRIWVRRQAASSDVLADNALPLLVDRYVVVLPGTPQLTPALKAAIVRTVLQDSLRPMPKWFENGLVSMLSGVSIDGQVMNLGPLPAGQQPYLDWAQVYWLLGSKQSIPTLSALAGNLEKGMEEQIALRNSYRLTPVQLQAEARKVMAAGSFPALEVGGLANNPRQDFRDWYVPLGYSNLATLSARALQPGQRGLAEAIAATRPEYEALDVRAVAEIQALDALVALREGEREDARTVLATLTDLANTQSAWVYLEAAKMARSAAEKRRLAGYAADKNTEWSAVYRFLATLEEDAAQRGKVLLKAAERAPRDYALWEETAQALVDGREYALADRALEAASQAAPDDAERQRLRDARWELREDRARKDEEERQKQLSAERQVMADLKAKTMERIEEALAIANKANESQAVIEEEVVQFDDLDEEQAAEGALVRVICRSDGQYLLEIKTLDGYTRLVLSKPESVTTEDGKPWEFRCGAQPNPQVVRATYRPKVSNSLGTIGEVLSLSLP